MQKIGGWIERVKACHAAEQVECFHCGERVPARRALTVTFAGEQRRVCCHGCATVLKTIEQMDVQRQYLEQKAAERGSDEK